MTLANNHVGPPPAVPLVRAPQAGRVAGDDTAEAANGLGASPSTAPVGKGRGIVVLPTSPADRDGMYQGVLWVAWAVEECSRAFTRLSSRVAQLERRLDRLDHQADTGTATPDGPSEGSEAVTALKEDLAELRRETEEQNRRLADRVGAVDERLRQLDFIPLKLSNLHRTVAQLASVQRPAPSIDNGHVVCRSMEEIKSLRHEVARAQSAVATLGATVSAEAVSALVEDAVERLGTRLAVEVPSPATDVEGVYRELDAVAEFVAARAASTAESLERIGPLEVAVLELRRDLGRIGGEAVSSHGQKDSDPRLKDVESRLQELELSQARFDRLISLLKDVVSSPDRAGTSAQSEEPSLPA